MKRITAHQWSVLSALILLGPALRILPRLTAERAGRACWLAPLAALPPLLLYALFLSRLWAERPADCGFAELAQSMLGERAARPVLLFFALWFLFYGGFLLRVGADRLVVTVYPHAPPRPFVLSMGLLCLLAALGSLRSIARAGKLLRPILYGFLLMLLFAAFKGVEKENLLPVTLYDLPAVTRASLPVLDVLGLGLFLPQFLLGYVPERPALLPRYVRWLLAQTLLLTLLLLAVAGSFGAELTAELTQPFFTLVRNLVFFRSLERIEALAVSCWVFPDFLLISLCLFTAQYCLRSALGERPARDSGLRLSLEGLRGLIPLCGGLCLLFGLTLGPDMLRLRRLSERTIPLMNLAVCYLSPPLLLLAERLLRRLREKPPRQARRLLPLLSKLKKEP